MALFDEISGVHEQKAWCAGVHHQQFLVCWCAPAFSLVVVKICKFAFHFKNAKKPCLSFSFARPFFFLSGSFRKPISNVGDLIKTDVQEFVWK